MPDLQPGSLGRVEHLWWATAAILLVPFAFTLATKQADSRLLAGESVWAKPLKFQLSLALHFATLALVAGWLGVEARTGTLLCTTAVLSVAATAFEVGYTHHSQAVLTMAVPYQLTENPAA